LTALGRVTFNGDSQFSIDASAFSSALHQSKIEGSIREKEGKYQIFLDYSSSFTTLGWIVFIICVLLWLIGLLWLLMPANAKGNIRKKAERVFEGIRFNYQG
jgi:hypothetical protein